MSIFDDFEDDLGHYHSLDLPTQRELIRFCREVQQSINGINPNDDYYGNDQDAMCLASIQDSFAALMNFVQQENSGTTEA